MKKYLILLISSIKITNAVKILANNKNDFILANNGQFNEQGFSHTLQRRPIILFSITINQEAEYNEYINQVLNLDREGITFVVYNFINLNLRNFYPEYYLNRAIATAEIMRQRQIRNNHNRHKNLILLFMHLDVFDTHEEQILRILNLQAPQRTEQEQLLTQNQMKLMQEQIMKMENRIFAMESIIKKLSNEIAKKTYE